MLLPLIGVGVVVLGFALRVNGLLVVVAAAIATGLPTAFALLTFNTVLTYVLVFR
jgi:uncharacterized membrane protein